jgi:hypothetical protein
MQESGWGERTEGGGGRDSPEIAGSRPFQIVDNVVVSKAR